MGDDVIRVKAEPVPSNAVQHMVPMRDGIMIASDVYLPPEDVSVETVLVRLPYDKDSRYVFMDRVAPHFTSRGYAVVVQDVRGKFRSGGETIGLVNESEDGYDSIEWITQQPWSNGVVGMFGDSYYGFTQWAAVSAQHPALRAIVPRVTSADLFAEPSHGTTSDVPWLVAADYLSHYWVDNEIQEFSLDYDRRPMTEVFEDAFRRIGARSRLYDMLVPTAHLIDSFPFGHPFDAPPVPVLHVVGWFDNILTPSMRDYVELSKRSEWAAHQYLSADSVDHENYHLSFAPVHPDDDHHQSERALERLLIMYVTPALDFFDVFLKGTRSEQSIPKVSWHLGHVGYRESPSWPPPEATEIRMALSNLSEASDGRGVLGTAPGVEGDVATWVHDPDDLVPSSVEDSFAFLLSYPDEQSLLERPDVVSFVSVPFTDSLDVAGPVDLQVTVSSTAPSTDVFAKLFDLGPDGSARLIVRGQATLLEPSGSAPVTIGMGHIGYRVQSGHRLCLALFSSDFPEFVPHPGTAENRWTAIETAKSTQVLFSDPAAPSCLVLMALA
jgi:putative CocE/NonD family hydrolase